MAREPNVIVIFDGKCGICQALRRQAEARDVAGRLHFTAYQEADLGAIAPGLTRELASRSLFVMGPDGRRWRGARAFFEAVRQLPGVWGKIGATGAFPPIPLLAEPFYRLVAWNRGRISRWVGLTQCKVELPE